LLGLDDVIDDQSLGIESRLVEFVEEEESSGLKVLLELDGDKSGGRVLDVVVVCEGNELSEDLGVVGDDLLSYLFLELGEDLRHAHHVATEVVDEDVVLLALVADVAELVVRASEDVHIAVTFR
jgi:hypothetical protein